MPEEKTSTESIDAFATRLLEEKGLGSLDEAVVMQLKEDLVSRIEDRLNAAMLDALQKDKIEECEKIIDQGDDDKIHAFFQEHIPNLDELIARNLMDFRRTYLG